MNGYVWLSRKLNNSNNDNVLIQVTIEKTSQIRAGPNHPGLVGPSPTVGRA